MITSCIEIETDDHEDPTRRFIVWHNGFSAPADVLRLCGKIPKPGQDRGDKWAGWICRDVSISPEDDSERHYRVRAEYKPPEIVVAEDSDDPKFPPYHGPKGNQPDGSFILTPKCVHFMEELFLRGGSQFPLNDHVHKFSHAIYEETGSSFAEWT